MNNVTLNGNAKVVGVQGLELNVGSYAVCIDEGNCVGQGFLGKVVIRTHDRLIFLNSGGWDALVSTFRYRKLKKGETITVEIV
jgi:hypothetical protein